MKTLTKKVLQLIPTLFCVVALSGVNPAWAKHCQDWNVACITKEKAEDAREAVGKAVESTGKATENTRKTANTATIAVEKTASPIATATVDWSKKQTVSLRELTRGISRDPEGIWYSPVPNKKVRLQASLGADAETNVVNVMSDANETDGRKDYPAAVRKYIDYYEGRKNPLRIPPEKINRRNKQLRVDNQGNRATSTAFAIGSAFEAIIDEKVKISKEYMYFKFKVGNTISTCKGFGLNLNTIQEILLTGQAFPEEKFWAYKDFTAAVQGEGFCPGDPPDEANKQAVFKADDVFRFGAKDLVSAKNPAFIEAWLDAGYDFILATGVAWPNKTMLPRYQVPVLMDSRGVIDVKKVAGKPATSYGNHAMLIVGYHRTDKGNIGGGYFLLKNSWGEDVGENGYLKLSYDYIRTYALDGMVITGVTKNKFPGSGV